MTVYGLDVSHYQKGLDLTKVKAQGYHFVMAKCTEGTYTPDSEYKNFRVQAREAGLLFVAYHFLHRGSIGAQAAKLAANIGDKSIPVMIDWERSGDSPTFSDVVAFTKACKRRGLRVTLDYAPEWYWSEMGRPSLKGRTIVQSAYPHGYTRGHGAELYGGDNDAHYDAFGGVKPWFWQFTSVGIIDGYNGNVDLDAYRGTLAGLKRSGLFKDYGKTAKPAPKPVPTPAPTPVPAKPAEPTRLENFHAKLNQDRVIDINILDRAIAADRNGTVRSVRDELERLAKSLPAR